MTVEQIDGEDLWGGGTCGKCRWWDCLGPYLGGKGASDGYCRRHAPSPLTQRELRAASAQAREWEEGLKKRAADEGREEILWWPDFVSWPLTSASDRCGEYEARKG